VSTPQPPTNGDSARRVRREARAVRRRQIARGFAILLALLLVTGAVLLLTGVIDTSSERPTLAARAGDPPGNEPATATSTPAKAKVRCRSPLTPAAPLRLWIGGDSLAGSLGPSLGNMTAETGVVAPVFDSRVSSGLSNPKFFDWPKHATTEMARLNPEVVAFIIGTNDYNLPPVTTTTSTRPGAGTGFGATVSTTTTTATTAPPAWRTAYAIEVEQMLQILIGPPGLDGRGRTVYWIGAPILKDPKMDAGAQQINGVAREIVARHPEATYVDAHQLFAGPDGKYTTSITGLNGKPVRVRAGDGVHLTPDGGDRLAGAVLSLLDARCHIETQAVAGAHQPVVQTKGSTQLPGTGHAPSSGSRSGSSVTTTVPTTQPAGTTAPPTDPASTTAPTSTSAPTTEPATSPTT
jgi:hypothetical protein